MDEKQEWETEEFWLKLRDQRLSRDDVGRNCCGYWCDDTLSRLPEGLDFERETVYIDFATEIIYRGGFSSVSTNRVLGHVWLQKVQNGRTFVADGTAGQLTDDERCKSGFYGWLEDAPEELAQLRLYDADVDT